MFRGICDVHDEADFRVIEEFETFHGATDNRLQCNVSIEQRALINLEFHIKRKVTIKPSSEGGALRRDHNKAKSCTSN